MREQSASDALDSWALAAIVSVLIFVWGVMVLFERFRQVKTPELLKRFGAAVARKTRAAFDWLSDRMDDMGALRRAVLGLAVDAAIEHAPLLRSRTISGALALKIIALVPWLIPESWHNGIVQALCIVGAGAMFARAVHGRMRANGPLRTPRDMEAGPMGPGAQAELDGAPRAFDDGGPAPTPRGAGVTFPV